MKKLVYSAIAIMTISGGIVFWQSNSPQFPSIQIEGRAQKTKAPKQIETKQLTSTTKSISHGIIKDRTNPQDPLWDYELQLPLALRQTEAFALLNQYQLTEADLLDQISDPSLLWSASVKILEILPNCLKENLCGIKRDPKDSYFRPNETPAHELLIRSLLVLQEISKRDPSLLEDLSAETLQGVLIFENQELQNIGLHLLSKKDLPSEDWRNILEEEGLRTTEAKATAFVELSNKATTDKSVRSVWLDALNDSFQKDAPITILSTLKELSKMQLRPDELPTLLPSLCRIKKENPQNWKRIQFMISRYAEANLIDLKQEASCF